MAIVARVPVTISTAAMIVVAGILATSVVVTGRGASQRVAAGTKQQRGNE
jgi:hypothetical protein